MKSYEKRAREALIEKLQDMNEAELLELLEQLDSSHSILEEIYNEDKADTQMLEAEYFRSRM